MNRKTICAAVATALSLAVCSAAEAGIVGAYDWVAYNSMNAYIGTMDPTSWPADYDPSYAPSGNITDYTVDTDRPGYTTSGELIDYDSGGGTGVNLEVVWSGVGQLFIAKGYVPPSMAPTPTEFDVFGTDYKGIMVQHGPDPGNANDRKQTLIFSGLDPSKMYEFYGISEGDLGHYNSFSRVDLESVVASVNESTVTTNSTTTGLTDKGWTGVNTPTQSWLSYANDDLMKFTGISPGIDGIISVVVTGQYHGKQGWAPGFDAVALAQVTDGGSVEPPGGGDAVPEPSSEAMAMMAALGVVAGGLYRGRRRRLAAR